jgi:4-alpha-glucanotransferase
MFGLFQKGSNFTTKETPAKLQVCLQSFYELSQEFGSYPLIREDLGLINKEITRLRQSYGFHGMKILKFFFQQLGIYLSSPKH